MGVVSAVAEAGAEVLDHAVGDVELRVRVDAIELLGQPHLVGAKWLAVGCGAVLAVGRAVADDAVRDDQRRLVGGRDEGGQAVGQRAEVVGVGHVQHLPAASLEARGDVLGEGEGGRAFDADVVAVVEPAEVAQPQVARQRRPLGRQPFHQVAVAAQRVHAVGEQRQVRPVVGGGQPALRQRHADAGGCALAERAGGGFDAGGVAVLGVAGAATAELAEAFQVGHRHRQRARLAARRLRPHAGQVQQAVQQRRGVARRQHEAVAVRPGRVHRVEAQEALPHRVGDRRGAHRRTGVAGAGLFDRVDGQRAQRGDAQQVERGFTNRGLVHGARL